eukprot:8840541-Pyramimonas_sp.AAC.1
MFRRCFVDVCKCFAGEVRPASGFGLARPPRLRIVIYSTSGEVRPVDGIGLARPRFQQMRPRRFRPPGNAPEMFRRCFVNVS